MIWDHKSVFGFSQRNAPSSREKSLNLVFAKKSNFNKALKISFCCDNQVANSNKVTSKLYLGKTTFNPDAKLIVREMFPVTLFCCF